jgi:multidrug/hemolysin transport system permease protein
MQKSMSDIKGARFLMDSWIMAGILAVTPITTSLGILESMIIDKKYKIYKDFAASPIKRSALASGYMLSGLTISLIMSVVTLALAEFCIVINGGELLNLEAFIKVLGIIILSSCFSSLMMFTIVSFFKSTQAFSVATAVIGTLIGFLTGVYIPIGNLPGYVQTIIKVFPPSHAAVLFRRVMMRQAEDIAFQDAPKSLLADYRLELGSTIKVGDHILSTNMSILFLVIVSILFFILSIKLISKKNKKGL